MRPTDYTPANWTYLQAIEAARAEIDAGHARAYAIAYNHDRGRYIEIQTDQGWNPDPFWQEHEPDCQPSDEPTRYY
jgi:hypothetical protein